MIASTSMFQQKAGERSEKARTKDVDKPSFKEGPLTLSHSPAYILLARTESHDHISYKGAWEI